MKKLLLILPLFLLTGCLQSVPIKPEFPKAVQELTTECPDLQLVPVETTKLSEILLIIVKNYGQYHECQAKVDGWIQWYNDQKKIYDSVK